MFVQNVSVLLCVSTAPTTAPAGNFALTFFYLQKQ